MKLYSLGNRCRLGLCKGDKVSESAMITNKPNAFFDATRTFA